MNFTILQIVVSFYCRHISARVLLYKFRIHPYIFNLSVLSENLYLQIRNGSKGFS